MPDSRPTTGRGREVPRPFKFHWGSGQIVEEASFVGNYVVYGIRFCYYSLDGRFQRSPMMLDGTESLEGMRAALEDTPRLRALLKQLVS